MTVNETEYQTRYISVDLPRLPDFKAVGGNKRGHWSKEYKARKAERTFWQWELIAAGYKRRTTALLQPPYNVTIVLAFPKSRPGPRPDKDNATAALKDLLDTLEPAHMTGNSTMRGFAGLISNDKDIATLAVEYTAGDAPNTAIHIWSFADEFNHDLDTFDAMISEEQL
jgi:Holliday junction resolvase RusA-like endonuclease